MSATVSSPSSHLGYEASSVTGTIVGMTGMYRYATISMASGDALIIGRDAVLAHLVIDEGAELISRRHCEVKFLGDGTGWSVTDFSSNGTFLADGRRLKLNKPTKVPSGSEIYLGNENNRFLLAAFSDVTERLKTSE